MQLGFDRQHFTLPRVGIFLGLNKGLPEALSAIDKSRASGESYSNSGSKAFLQTNSIWCGKLEGADTWGPMEQANRSSTALVCSGMSSVGNSVRAIVDM